MINLRNWFESLFKNIGNREDEMDLFFRDNKLLIFVFLLIVTIFSFIIIVLI